MGVEPFLIAYSINIVLAQRLLRKLCDRCKSPIQDPDREVLRRLGMKDEEIGANTFYRAIGCNQCVGGYKGRMAIHEALYFTKDIRRIILNADKGLDEEALREKALEQGMRTLRVAALDLLKKGITSIEEVASTTVEEE